MKSRENILGDLRKSFHKIDQSGDHLVIRYRPSSFFFWDGRGKVNVQMETLPDGKTILDCRFTPLLFYFDISQFLFLILLGLFSFTMSRTALTFDIVIWMVLAWLAIVLIAPYLILLAVVAGTLLMLLSYSYFALASTVISWLLTWALVSLVLSYNRKRLEQVFLRAIQR